MLVAVAVTLGVDVPEGVPEELAVTVELMLPVRLALCVSLGVRLAEGLCVCVAVAVKLGLWLRDCVPVCVELGLQTVFCPNRPRPLYVVSPLHVTPLSLLRNCPTV